jgi:hypothetical protein
VTTGSYHSEAHTAVGGALQQKSRLLIIIVTGLFLLAAAIRIYDIGQPFVGLEPVREYRSAIISRIFYFGENPEIPDWRREIAVASRDRESILEPPILEAVTALAYRITDGERLWIPRLLSTASWLVGGLLLYKIAETLLGIEATLVATAYYLFVPIGVIASKSFQPDALMIMLFLGSLLAIIRYYDQPTLCRILLAALLSSLALIVKPIVLFVLLGAFISLKIYHSHSWKRLFDRHLLLYGIVALLPMAAYYIYGMFVTRHLDNQVQMSFQPHLYLRPEYWGGWLLTGVNAVKLGALVLALLGLSLVRNERLRFLLVGLWVGYFVLGLVFNFHLSTHGYYHLQLIPIVALSMGSLVTLLDGHLREHATGWFWWLPIASGLLVLLVLSGYEVAQHGRHAANFESQPVAEQIGEIVKHSNKTVFLSPYYGRPLEYLGELTGNYWPRSITSPPYQRPGERELTVEERINAFNFLPEYFVVTDFNEFNIHHADLNDYLDKNCDLLAESESYLIFETCSS